MKIHAVVSSLILSGRSHLVHTMEQNGQLPPGSTSKSPHCGAPRMVLHVLLAHSMQLLFFGGGGGGGLGLLLVAKWLLRFAIKWNV